MIEWLNHSLRAACGLICLLPATALAQDGDAETARPRPAPSVVVTVERPDLRLEQQRADGEWETACSSPCVVTVPTGRDARIVGAGIRSSAPFRFAGRDGEHVTLSVAPATAGGTATGAVMVGIGPVLMFAGLALSVVSLAQTLGDAPSGDSRYDLARAEGRVGGVLLLSGAVATAVGVPLGILTLVANGRTRVSQEPSPSSRHGIERAHVVQLLNVSF